MLLPGLDNTLVSDDWVFVYRGVVAEGPGQLLAVGESGWFSRPTLWLLAYVIGHLPGVAALPEIASWPYHLVSATVHLANTLLLGLLGWYLGARLGFETASRGWNRRALLAFGSAGLFLTYSQHHEVLYWFSAIPEALALGARLTALVLLVQPRGRTLTAVGATALLTVFGLASKESAIVLPAELALLAGLLHWSGPQADELAWRRRAVGQVLASALVAVPWLLWYLAGGTSRTELTLLELGPLAWLLRLGQAGWRALAFGKAPDTVLGVGALLLGWALLLGLAWRRRWFGVLFAGIWLALCLLPYVAITWIGDQEMAVPVLLRYVGIAEPRYFYGAGAALSLGIVATTLRLESILAARRPDAGNRRRLRAALLGAWVLLASLHAARLLFLERDWDRAGEVVEAVRAELDTQMQPPVAPGELICVFQRPDSYRGRFVLRSGISELVWLEAETDEVQVLAPPWTEGAPCTRSVRFPRYPGVVPTD